MITNNGSSVSAFGVVFFAPLSVDFDRMYRGDLILGVAFMLGLLVVTFGAWKLMSTLQTKSAGLLFLSLAIFYCWVFFSETLFFSIFSYFDSEIPYEYIDSSRVFLRVGMPALLMVSIALNFLLVAGTISRNCKAAKAAKAKQGSE